MTKRTLATAERRAFAPLLKNEHVTVGFRDQRSDAADAKDAGYHSRADLEVDDAPVFRSFQRRIV
jgi:hypothetical protein